MKRMLLILFLMSFGFSVNYAQDAEITEGKITTDVHTILNKQIEEAQQKLNNQNLNSIIQTVSKGNTSLKSSEKIPKESNWLNLSNFSFEKKQLFPFFLLIEVLLIGTILAIWLKSKRFPNGKSEVELKEVVRKMRMERIGSKIDPEISEIRTSLTKQNFSLNDGGKSITKFARKKNIAKGELQLAMKLRILASMYK